MIYYILSIAIITTIFYFLNKKKIVKVCPVCAAVVLTWVAGLIGIYTNQAWANPVIVAILLAASLGAVAEKYGSRFGLLWKTILVLLGFPSIYFIVQKQSFLTFWLLLALALITIYFIRGKKSEPDKDLFKECC